MVSSKVYSDCVSMRFISADAQRRSRGSLIHARGSSGVRLQASVEAAVKSVLSRSGLLCYYGVAWTGGTTLSNLVGLGREKHTT